MATASLPESASDESAVLRKQLALIEAEAEDRRLQVQAAVSYLLFAALTGIFALACEWLAVALGFRLTAFLTVGVPIALMVLLAAIVVVALAVLSRIREADVRRADGRKLLALREELSRNRGTPA